MDSYMQGRRYFIDNLAVALLISVNYLNLVITKLGLPGMLSSLVFIAAIMLIISIIVIRKGKILINRRLGILISTITIYYVISCVIPNKTNIGITEFIAFCILPLAVGAFSIIDYELVFKLLMIFLCAGIPVFNSIFEKANHSLQYNAMALSTSYGAAPIVIAGLVHFLFYGKEKQTFYTKVLYFLSFVFFLYYIPNSYRGPILSIFITFLLIWMSKGELIRSPKKLGVAILLLFGAVLIYYNFTNLLLVMKSFAGRYGISIATLDKTLLLGNDLSDGRRDIYAIAISGIMNSPIIGHGISTFPYYTGGIEYPHNFILQLLFDGGIMLLLVIALVTVPSYIDLFRNKNIQPKCRIPLIILLSGVEITRAFLSGNTWSILQFWLLIGILINNNL